MTHTVEMTKDNYYGNIAETSVSLGPVELVELGKRLSGERMLRVRTSRDRERRIISSFASVSVLVDSGRGYRTQIMAIFSDFTSRLGTVSTKAATAKEIARVHEAALLDLPGVIESAKSFYAARGAL